MEPAIQACLNCGTELRGRFCSHCGQRNIPPHPTLYQLTHDAWVQFSGWDGRFMRTFLTLLRHPGAMTVDVIEGRRARYVTPFRIYLTASVLYFLVAAATPNLRAPAASVPGADVKIDLRDPSAAQQLTPEQREQLLKAVERAPWWAKPILKSAATDGIAFRQRVLATLPRVLFVLVPVFAAIVSLFYRRRRFPQHLVFALHLHAMVFFVLAVGEAANFTRSAGIAGVVALAGLLFLLVYTLRAFRRVYGDGWIATVLKSAAVGLIYMVAGAAGLFLAVLWAATQ